jgi:hypothetical protein
MKHLLKKALIAGVTTSLVAMPLVVGAQAFTNPFESGQKNVEAVGGAAQIASGTSDINVIVGRIINVVLGFLGIVLLFYFLYGGFKWMTAGGEEEGVKEAKTMLRNAVIGLVIIMASYALSNFVLTQLARVTST